MTGSALSGTGSSRSELDLSETGSSLSSASGPDMDVAALRDPARLTFELLVDPHEVYPLLELYEQLLGWVDPDLRLFRAAECRVLSMELAKSLSPPQRPKGILVNKNHNIPEVFRAGRPDVHEDVYLGETGGDGADSAGSSPVSVILFLFEEDACSGGRVDRARKCLSRAPWKFHHCEKASRRNLNLTPHSLDYFFLAEDLPLWSVRQVHYGKEHVRVVVRTSEGAWPHMVRFYQLVLGLEPDLLRDDFCLFTVHSQIHFDIQFALKKDEASGSLTRERPSPPQSARLRFKVADLGRLVPLFPNVCRPLTDSCWLTTDHDGNQVLLDLTAAYVTGSATSSASERTSSESCGSTSSSDVSFDSHDSANSASSGESAGQGHLRSSLQSFVRRKAQGGGDGGEERRKSQRRVTFCFDDVTSTSSPPPTPPPPSVSRRGPGPRLTPVSPPRVPPLPSPTAPSPCSFPSPPETRFNLKFDTCPTAPLSHNNRREEQIGFYV